MSRLVEWLLDLDRIRLGEDAPVSLQWQPPFEAYVMFGFALLLAAFVALMARREQARLGQRLVLAVLRGALIALVLVLLCRPVLVLQRERVEPSCVALLVDTSHSMARQERYLDENLGAAVAAGAGLADASELSAHSRLDLVRRALLGNEADAVRTVLRHHELRLLAFADEARVWASIAGPDDLPRLAESFQALSPDGTATNVPGALTETIARHGGERLAAVILAGDAQTNVPANLSAAIDLAKARQVPVFALRIGSPHPPQDVSVGPLVAEENVFRDDLVAVRCRIVVTGLDQPGPISVTLIDEQVGAVIARQSVELGGATRRAEIEFRIRPPRTGLTRYRAEAEPLPAEDETRNNADRVEIRVLDEKLRVLYVEGYPRYEYRYLKNALLREETVESSCLLLSGDADFAQEGTFAIRRFPETPEELNRYDVILFGDVDPTGDWLSPGQADLLVEFVSEGGGGFGLIAGERHAPHRFAGTVLEKLVPARIDPEFLGRYQEALTAPFVPRMTVEGRHARCFRFDRSPELSQQLFESLPGLYWIARTLGPKPGAEVLLEHPGLQTLNGAMPVVVLGRYGAGKVLLLTSDDTWRWRRHAGEYLHDIFWVQLVRMLRSPTDTGQDHRLRLACDRTTYAYAERVAVRLEVSDAELLAALGDHATLALLDAQSGPVATIRADRVDPSSNMFEAWFVPPRAGAYVLRCRDIVPRAGDRPASTLIRVEPADLEARHPEADHDLLGRIAAETGGGVVDLNRMSEAFARIRDRSVRIPDDITEPLWDSKLALVLFVVLITTEWTLRKAFAMI